jgi:hypothetical protein
VSAPADPTNPKIFPRPGTETNDIMPGLHPSIQGESSRGEAIRNHSRTRAPRSLQPSHAITDKQAVAAALFAPLVATRSGIIKGEQIISADSEIVLPTGHDRGRIKTGALAIMPCPKRIRDNQSGAQMASAGCSLFGFLSHRAPYKSSTIIMEPSQLCVLPSTAPPIDTTL